MGTANIRALLIEDNPGDARLIQEFLREANPAGLDLVVANRLVAGLTQLEQEPFDVLLLDLTLPESHGMDTFFRAHSQAPGLPIVVLTGLDDETMAVHAVQEGAQDYLVKGRVDGQLLVRAIRYAIERKQAGRALRESQQLLQRTFLSLREAVFIIDAATSKIINCNPAAVEIFGYARQEMLGRTTDFLHVDASALDEFRRRLYAAIEQEGFLSRLEFRMRRKNGEIFPTEHTVTHLEDEQARRIGWVSVVRDITERKQMLDALKKHQDHLEELVSARTAELVAEKEKTDAILHSVGDAILVADRDMRVRYVNPAFTALTGFAAHEVLGQHVSNVGVGAQSKRIDGVIESTIVQGQSWHGQVTGRRNDGRTYDAELTVAPVRDADGQVVGCVSSHRDISRQKELERARTQFIRNISHELRSPVTNLKLYARLARRAEEPGKRDHCLEVIEGQVNRLQDLIEGIVEMSVLDSGQALDTWETISIAAIVEIALKNFHGEAESHGLHLTVCPLPPDLPPARGDPQRVSQALNKVIDNALAYTPAGSDVKIEVQLTQELDQPWVTIAVHDTGPGISARERERIFERFYRGKRAQMGHVPGTGLGLSIAQEIMRAHGGKITVESQPGHGSTFTLWLRAVQSP